MRDHRYGDVTFGVAVDCERRFAAGPGCRFGDMDDDTDVDLHDFAVFQNAFTGGD